MTIKLTGADTHSAAQITFMSKKITIIISNIESKEVHKGELCNGIWPCKGFIIFGQSVNKENQ